jgi:D-glycero-alpha-D-manno-heptose-7-phosphate kinase
MIVTRTPFRISLGGGGTDLPFYCSKFGSSLVCGAINKYMYITVSERMDNTIKLNYSKTEVVNSVDEIQHALIREALKLTGVDGSVEIHSVADIDSGTGLGSSASFLVGLLNALYYYNGEIVSKYKLAEDASHITMDVLKEPCGKQDQYAAAFGNLLNLRINQNERVTVTPINIKHENLRKLERNLMMFYTGLRRSATEVIEDQKKNSCTSDDVFDYYHEIKKIGKDSMKCLESGNLRRFGEWMNIHWELKKSLSDKMTNPQINKWYDLAMANGAIGGKIIGAGGGGFMMFYTEDHHEELKKAMAKEGLVYTDFRFDFDGSKIVYDGKHF